MTHPIKSICVFCGANAGNNPIYAEAARELAHALIDANIDLIYGGAKVGLMGIIANEMLSLDGNVIGVMPEKLVRHYEVSHTNLTKLHIVNSMHERKLLMIELADAFIMLPGAAGSLDEFYEVMTLAQLHYHTKPFGIININHYYDSLLDYMKHAVNEGFLHQSVHDLMIVENNVPDFMQRLVSYSPENLAITNRVLETQS